MAPSRLLDRPIQPRHEFDEDDYSEEDEVENASASSAGTNTGDDVEEGDQKEEDSSEHDSQSASEDSATNEGVDLRDISFGALAEAQKSLAPASRSRKRKLAEVHDDTHPELMDAASQKVTKEDKHPDSRPNQPLHRSSKHAPMVLSSKHPVSRKRLIFEPSGSLKSRDPRFDAAIKSTTHNSIAIQNADKNYAFLTTYQATEVLDLKTQIKKTKDPQQVEDLKRQIMSLEAKIRNAQTKQKEREVQLKHKHEERAAIREGRKTQPYFLKPSDVRKRIEQERLDGMGKKAKDQMEKRKLKRQKGKEGRDMPRFRRSAAG